MAKLAIKKASTDVTVYLFIQDSSATTGAGLTGLTFETASLVASYVRPLAARAALTLATQTVDGAHSDGGFVEVDATNMPGVYRLDLSDAVCATGVPSVVVMLKGAANMAPLLLEIQLTDFDLNTAAITAAGVADAVWDEATADHTTGTTFGGKNQKVVPSETINDYKADVSALTNVTLAATQTGVTIPTVTNLTNAPTGMALEATLTAIKGATWTDETLVGLMTAIEGISAGSGASVADILNALLASYTVSGSVGESLGRLDNIQAKTDLITTGTSLSIASAVAGSTITAHRGDTLSAALENIGALTNYSKIWFTVKRDYDDADSAAVVQIEKTDGLKYLNGAAVDVANKTNGSITIQDEATGDVTVALVAAETAKLSPGNYQYDIQILRSAGTPVSTLTYGEFVVAADVTKATA